jgi:ATP-dependent Lon protease
MAKKRSKSGPDDVEVVHESPLPSPDDRTLVLARDTFPPTLPIVPMVNRPVFPRMTVPIVVEDKDLRHMLVETARSQRKFVGIILQRPAEQPDQSKQIQAKNLHDVGVIAEILQLSELAAPNAPVQVVLGAMERFHVEEWVQEDPHFVARVRYEIETEMKENPELKAYSVSVIQALKELLELNPLHKEELSMFMSRSSLAEPGRLADFSAALTTASAIDLQEILETFRITDRLRKVLVLLRKEISISKIQAQIQKQIDEKLSKQQREFFLREQLKAIKKELGLEKEGKQAEIDRFEERVRALELTDEAKERIEEEISKLRLLEPVSPEFNVTRNYLDWLTSLPWGVFTEDRYDIEQAERVLNHDHYGLDDVKERILEFLSVGILKGNVSGSILCFVGPPGVGKTSLGHSIAASIGRTFYRFSIGGIRDEAEIKGHRRTYIGALPGKFIQSMKTCKSANPVIMIDEIDKIGASFRGDPASALLEVLDPEQNREFLDHYLDIRFDLSNVLFICTANQLDTIPHPLLDRMEVIKLAGYILEEKLEIACRYLVPRQLKAHGLRRADLKVTRRALREIIDGYAREPGVRGVENHIKKIMRKAVKKIVEKKAKTVTVDKADVSELLGKRLFTDEPRGKRVAGVVTGLAWTRLGGDTLTIEAIRVETGKGGFKQTGQLGNVMVESSELAYTYVRAFLNDDLAAREFFSVNFIHLHVPAGATPKDGPSAGVTMATALYSLAKNSPIRKHFAMTGELTLTGLVMPIGGLKEKTIAAKRAKVSNLVFPAGNRRDFEELPEHIRKGLKPHFVSTFREIVDLCF